MNVCPDCRAVLDDQEVSTRRKAGRVVVVDLQMPFLSMVVFLIKWTLAAIPALAPTMKQKGPCSDGLMAGKRHV